MIRRWHYDVLLLTAVFLTLPSQADTQMIKWSQSGSVTQMLGDTEIEIRYSRPVARGRELFGGIVPWGKVWAPGADSATTIAFSREVLFAGQHFPTGRYSIWMIPDPESWTIILSTAAEVYHTPYPEGFDVLRVQVEPTRGMHVETLTFHFPLVDGPNAVLAFQWGETVIQLPIAIELEEG
jgi:hypothetical protein